MNKKPPVIFLMGPTASGKTDLAMALHDLMPVELISVDSALVYRGMDIGSAKPTKKELEKYPHRLIDIRDPSEPYSAADFVADAEREIADIHMQGKIPLLVGGTMLYFKALLDGLADMPEADANVRAKIEKDAELHGWAYVHQQLAEVDPQMALEIHPNHSQRLSRALEVFLVSGKTMTQLRELQSSNPSAGFAARFDLKQMAIAPRDRQVLHQRIEQRFTKMIEQGFVDEVRGLFHRGDLHPDLPAIRAVGYRQVWEYFDQKLNHEEMIERGIIATRQLAKRQLTWLKGWSMEPSPLYWLYTQDEQGRGLLKKEIIDNALNFLQSTAI